MTEHRYKAVLAVIADGRTVTEVARDCGESEDDEHRRVGRISDDKVSLTKEPEIPVGEIEVTA